jgi:predicted HicB family RNase H-like nuclease
LRCGKKYGNNNKIQYVITEIMMRKKEFTEKAETDHTYVAPCRKDSVSTTIRLTKSLDERISSECEKLGMSRNSWLVSAIDRELRRANLERMLEDDPYMAKKIISGLNIG